MQPTGVLIHRVLHSTHCNNYLVSVEVLLDYVYTQELFGDVLTMLSEVFSTLLRVKTNRIVSF